MLLPMCIGYLLCARHKSRSFIYIIHFILTARMDDKTEDHNEQRNTASGHLSLEPSQLLTSSFSPYLVSLSLCHSVNRLSPTPLLNNSTDHLLIIFCVTKTSVWCFLTHELSLPNHPGR